MPRVRAPASDASTTGSATSTRWRDSKAPDSSTRSVVSQQVTAPSPLRNCSRPPSDAQCFDHRLGDLAARVLLLAGDQPPVADDEGLEEAALHVVGPALAQRVLH